MQSLCGQCQKPYSLACEKSFKCQWHQSDCFSCKPCKQTAPPSTCKLIKCTFCPRVYPEEDLYYQYKCNNYICCHHFLKHDFTTSQFKLPCGHMEDADQIICFMSSFCIYCARKMHFNSSWCIGICYPCQKNASIKENQTPNQEKQSQKQPAKQQIPHEQKKFQLSQSSEGECQMQIVRILQRDLEESHQRLEVADHARKSMRKILLSGDRECPICLQSYDLQGRKPFMICLMQHLVCENCFNSQLGLIKCPLCHQPIVREHVMVSRQKRITLQLQSFLAQKYQYHLGQLLRHKNKIEQKEPSKAEITEQHKHLKQNTTIQQQKKATVSQQTQTMQAKALIDMFPRGVVSVREGSRLPKATKSKSAAALKPDKK